MENKENNNQAQKTEDELWDELMESPESAIFFENLDKQITQGIQSGELKEDNFDSDD